MKQQKFRLLYSTLLIQKHNNIEDFLLNIKNHDSCFWECCRDISEETLLSSRHWNWLGGRVDDFAKIVKIDAIEKLDKWILKDSSLSKVCRSGSLKDVINWLFERHTSMLKNLFDSRYKNSLVFSVLINFDEHVIDNSASNDNIYLDEFLSFSNSMKINIIKNLWKDNILDINFDLEDLRFICEKYQAPPPETFLNIENITKYEVKQNENGNSQLVFNF